MAIFLILNASQFFKIEYVRRSNMCKINRVIADPSTYREHAKIFTDFCSHSRAIF